MRRQAFGWCLAVASMIVVGTALGDEAEDGSELVDVDLGEQDRIRLLAATQVFMNAPPSEPLARAITQGKVERIRADRLASREPPVVQGWIYYPEVDGVRPIVLCVSESYPVLEWMHCQEETVDERHRKCAPNNSLDRTLVPVTALAEQGPRQDLRAGQLGR